MFKLCRKRLSALPWRWRWRWHEALLTATAGDSCTHSAHYFTDLMQLIAAPAKLRNSAVQHYSSPSCLILFEHKRISINHPIFAAANNPSSSFCDYNLAYASIRGLASDASLRFQQKQLDYRGVVKKQKRISINHPIFAVAYYPSSSFYHQNLAYYGSRGVAGDASSTFQLKQVEDRGVVREQKRIRTDHSIFSVANASPSSLYNNNKLKQINIDYPIFTVANTPSSSLYNNKSADYGSRRVTGGASSRFQQKQIEYEGLVTEKVDCLVIGAGVVGLAVARHLAIHGRSVVVVEAESTIGTATSSRNSEVIHAGIYYPPGSLKAALCVEGRKSMYAFCREFGVPHKQIGKLIVATSEQQVPVLEKLQKIGRENGVEELYMLEGEEAMNMEPQLKCVKALFSPLTGIIDSHAYMLALQASAEDSGVTFAFKTTAVGGRLTKNGIDVVLQNTHSLWEEDSSTKGASERIVLSSRTVVNCAGLLAQAFVKGLNGFPSKFIPKNYLAKGSYFSFAEAAKSAFSHLVYPVPEEGGLGVHLTLDLASRVKFGPDVEWLSAENIETNILTQFDYTVNQNRAQCFYAAIRTYYPSLPDNCLAPDYAGIRPKLSGPGEKPADFMIQGEDCHGVSGLVNLFGIESPGLTASLAIANFVHNKISKR